MNYFNWKKIYEIGNAEIDNQHKEIVLSANKFFVELFSETFNKQSKEIFKILEEFKNICDYHFKFENSIYSADVIEIFHEQEKELLDTIIKLLNSQRVNVVELYSFAEFLRKWVVDHIFLLNNNMDFKKAIKAKLQH